MKNYRITRRHGEHTDIKADSFDIQDGSARFFRELKGTGIKDSELIAVFTNFESVEEQSPGPQSPA